MAEEAPPDYGSLPLVEKLAHKVWKARSLGYEEAVTLFKRIDDENSSEYTKYVGQMKKFVTDTNALAQDKGLDAALVFVEYAAIAAKVAAEVVEGIVMKCLNQKPKTKEKGMLICLMFVEIEQAPAVQEELMKGFGNKQPKIVAACIETLTRAVREFGPKAINIKSLMKILPKLFEHSDKTVREQAKALANELYRWLRDAIKASLSGLKPVQLKELEDGWSSMPTDPARPTRLLRSQQAKAAEAPAASADAAAGGGDGEAEAAAAEEIDPLDFIEAVAVLEKLPSDFFEKIVDKKWQERKEALDALLEIAAQPKLAAGSYGDLLQVLKKVVAKDTNVMMVAAAAKCVALLAVGLRKDFSQYVSLLFSSFLEKFKEKKITVVSGLREAVDAMVVCVGVSQHIEEIISVGLESKNPAVKAETILMLTRSFAKSSPAMVPKPMLKQLCPILLKKFDDTTPLVRDSTAECLGTLQKLMGERAMGAYLADLDKSRAAKVTEAAEKAEITPPKGSAAPKAAAVPAKTPAAKPAAAAGDILEEPKAPVKKRPMLSGDRRKAKPAEDSKEESGGSAAAEAEPAKAAAPPARKPPMKKPAASKPASKPAASAASASSGKAKAGGGKGGDGGPFKEPEGPPEPSIAAEEVDEKAAAVFPAELLTALDSKAWKDRLQAYEDLVTALKGIEETHTYLVIKIMAKKPGWKDTNFQVMKAKFETVVFLAQNTPFGKKSAHCVFPGLVDKLGDIKVKGVACEALSAISEALSLNYVSLQVSKLALEHKSPKVQQEALTWLNGALRAFGLMINIKPHIDYIKTCLCASNAGVRTAAIALLGVAHIYLGAQLRMFFEEEKPALLAQIDAEFEKMKDEKPPVPTRGPKAGEDPSAAGGGGGGGGGAASLADLMPRNDISGQIKPAVITDLADKQWKVRGEALTAVSDIISAAKFITPALGDLPSALKGRLADSNKNLVSTTLNILASIATAMGPPVKKYLPVLGTAMVSVLGDAKPQVRAAAVACLTAYCQEIKLNAFLEGGYIAAGLATENPNLRGELLVWFEQKLSEAGSVCSEVKETVHPLYICLEDRNADVRKKAQLVVAALMTHIGIDYMVKATGKLKGSSKPVVVAVLEKHRSASAAAAPAAAAASSKPATKAAASSTAAKGQPGKTASVKKPSTSSAPGQRGAAVASSSSSAAASAADEDGPPLTSHGGKEVRMKAERDMKSLKWNFNAPRPEHLDQLKEQLTPCLSKKQFTEMFHVDFKHHIVALDALIKVITPDSSGAAPQQDEAVSSLDLLLRWVSLRFFDTNTSVLLKALDFLACLFRMLSSMNYHLSEYEASAFIPYLVQKVGDAKDQVRKAVRGLFQLVCDVYPASKMYVYVMDGTQSKNSRQRIECLEEVTCLTERHTINVCQPTVPKAVAALSAHISDRDNSVRSATLNALVGVYAQLEEAAFWKYLGSVSEKERSLLEERIKRSSKKPVSTAAATGKTSQAPESRLAKPAAAGAQGEKKTLGGLRHPQASIRSVGTPSYNSLTAATPSQMRPVSNSPPSSLDNLLRQVTSAQLATAVQALRELESQMQSPESIQSLSARIDDLLLALAQQLQIACSIHAIRCKGDSPDELMRLLKYIVHVQVTLLQHNTLAQAVSRRGFTQLLWQLLASLKDESLLRLPDIAQLYRTINILFVRYFEMCRPNETLGAVIELLGQCVQEGSSRANLTELVLKCLWRLTRMLDKLLETCRLDRLFLDLHNFLLMHPSAVWRQRSNNLPLRSIKTIIHHVAEKIGPQLMDHLSLVENADESELMLFLQKRLATASGGSSAAPTRPGSTSTEAPAKAPPLAGDNGEGRVRSPLASSSRDNVSSVPGQAVEKPSASAGSGGTVSADGGHSPSSVMSILSSASPLRQTTPLSSSARQQLAEIVSKIGERENSQKGLQELYDFVQSHPDANVAPYFDLCSPEFRNFVEKSLRNIARQRARDSKASPAKSVGSSALQENSQVPQPASGSVGKSEAELSAGLLGQAPSSDVLLASQATQAAAKSNQDTLANFRKRLERIKDSTDP